MSNKCIIVLILFATIAVLFACSNNSSDDSIKSLRIDAENAFRRGDYKEAYEICSRIVARDSSVSFGYHGMAKAGFGERGINIADILIYIETEEDDAGETKYKFEFLDSPVKEQNNIFQAMKKVSAALAPIDRRDSLTYLYEFHQRNITKGFDTTFTITETDADGREITKRVPLAERLRDFRNTFCNAAGNCSDTDIKKTPFPLVDREYKGDYLRPFLLISQMVKSLLDFYDSDKNGCIAKRGIKGIDYPEDSEWAKWGCSTSNAFDLAYGFRIENGKLIIDMENITEDDAEALNDKIDGFSGDINEVVDIMNAAGMSGSGDLKGEVGNFKGYSAFYKIGTGIDEDGDGCIEEDILDGQDNDGDGIKNGNARIAFGKINHSMVGEDPESPENINNPINDTISLPAPVYISNRKGVDCNDNPNPSLCTELWGDEETKKVTVVRFTQEPGYWTSNDMARKLMIAQDTACPPKYSLERRVELIGGCWRYYNEEKFVKYWLKRGLARDKNRIHPTCKACEGIEECLK